MAKHFLVIDDDVTILEYLKQLLPRHFDVEVECMSDPEGALHLFLQKADQYDLIIADLLIPKLSGLQLCRMIRNENATVPIIILTGHPSNEAYDDASAIGINEFVQKPVNSGAFIELINKILTSQDRRISRMQGFENQFMEQVGLILTGKIPAGYSSLDFIVRVLRKNNYAPRRVDRMEKMLPMLKTEISFVEARNNYLYLKTLQDQRVSRIRQIQQSILDA